MKMAKKNGWAITSDLASVVCPLITSHLPSLFEGLVDWLVVLSVEWLVDSSGRREAEADTV